MVCQQVGMTRSRLFAAVAALAVVLAVAAVAAGSREMTNLGTRRALLAGELLPTRNALHRRLQDVCIQTLQFAVTAGVPVSAHVTARLPACRRGWRVLRSAGP